MGLFLGIALKALGFGKLLLTLLFEFIKGIVKFAVKYPFQFLTLFLSAVLVFLGWYAVATHNELEQVRIVVKNKETFIKEQGETLKVYVKALEKEKVLHHKTIETNNKAVANLKKVADKAQANARKEAAKVEAKRQEYLTLAAKYKAANPSTGTPQERINREEETTDQFIKDWRKAE
jgi:hypothetical protein